MNLAKSLELFRENLQEYHFDYSIKNNVNLAYDLCEEFTLRIDNCEKVMKLVLVSQVCKIWTINFVFYLSDNTIAKVKSLIELLQIPDWNYSIKYSGNKIYDWIKPKIVIRNFIGEPVTKCIHTNDFSAEGHDCVIHDNANYSEKQFIYYRFNSDNDDEMFANSCIIAIINGDLAYFDLMPALKYIYTEYEDGGNYRCYARDGVSVNVYELAISLIK